MRKGKKPPARMRNKQYKYLWKKCQDEKIIRQAWKNLRRNKTKRKSVMEIDKNLNEEVKKMQKLIAETVAENPAGGYNPPKTRKTKIVHEKGKKRTAHLADIHEQWYFHILVEVMQPIILRRLSKNAVGCVPGRGAHLGKHKIEKLISEGARYYIKGDVRHFYDNIRIDIVIKELRRDIADERFLYLIRKIYRYQPKGILIGLYISPWLANYILIPVDDLIERTDNTGLVRYVDDLIITSTNKKVLHRLLTAVRIALGKLRLKLKHNYQVIRLDYETKNGRIGRPIDFMGFEFWRDRTVIRKCILLAATRTAKKLWRAKQEGRGYYARQVRGLVSLMGWFQWTNSYDCYLAYIKPCVDIGKLKRIISKLDKEAKKNDGMEEGDLRGTAA